ncbi:MAG: hemin uptake protein HemP [Pseudomonadota bacterium]
MNTVNQPVRTVPQGNGPASPARLKSQDLLLQAKTIQIEHDGRIYELRVTRHNKLILTA